MKTRFIKLSIISIHVLLLINCYLNNIARWLIYQRKYTYNNFDKNIQILIQIRKTDCYESVLKSFLKMLSPLNYGLQIPTKSVLLFYSVQYKIKESMALLANHLVQEISYLYVLYTDLVLVFDFFS
jgi:hypothetical protein